MTLIRWDSSFNVGIDIIDKQHLLLTKMINDLYDVMFDGKDKTALGKLIKRIGVYATMHFAREEHYFETLGYPQTTAHVKEHENFEDKVYEFESDFINGKQELTVEVMHFLSDWLITHIKGSDKEYAPFLRARGIS